MRARPCVLPSMIRYQIGAGPVAGHRRAAGTHHGRERREQGTRDHRNHAQVGGLLALVHRPGAPRRARRLLAGQGLHGDPALRIRDLGVHPARPRRSHQGHGPRQRLLPALHPQEPADEGGGARRGIRAPGGMGHKRRHRRARGAAGRAADVGSHHRDDVRQVDPVVARPARAHQPVGQHRPLGESDAPVPAHHRVPVAGRPYRARDGGGGRGGDAQDPGALQGVRRDRAGHSRHRGAEVREREVRRGGPHVFDRGPDGRRPGAAGGHLAQPRPELRQSVRHQVPGPRQVAPVHLGHVVGDDHPPHWRASSWCTATSPASCCRRGSRRTRW